MNDENLIINISMGKENLHMYMQETAVKQRGRRQYGDLSIEKGIPKFTGEQYSLSPSDIKYNYSEGNELFLDYF